MHSPVPTVAATDVLYVILRADAGRAAEDVRLLWLLRADTGRAVEDVRRLWLERTDWADGSEGMKRRMPELLLEEDIAIFRGEGPEAVAL